MPDTRLLSAALVCLAAGVLFALMLDRGPLLYIAELTALAIGLGLLRRAFRVE